MTDDPKPVAVQKLNRTTGITIASISAIFVLFVAALWGAGFLTFSGSDPSSKVVAAALALVGGLVAAVVSIVGLLLKYSIDQRTEMRLQIESRRAAEERKIESERASALQTQAEQRLSLEAAIRAVELLGKSEGDAGALQRAGALFALTNLDQHQLTLDIAAYLIQRNELEPNIACSLIDRAMKSANEDIQAKAIEVLYQNADQMLTVSGYELPDCISDWSDCLGKYARRLGVGAMAKLLLARPLSVWKTQFSSQAYSIIAALAMAYQFESDDYLKSNVAAVLNGVLKAFAISGIIDHPKAVFSIDQIAIEVAGAVPSTEQFGQCVAQIESWGRQP